jgi:predicted enzyme related to lactoylglutathione lyase
MANLSATVAFYRDTLGWIEAWRESDDTVAFAIPNTAVQLMVSTTDQPGGPMYLVDSVEAYLSSATGLTVSIEPYGIPDGTVVGLTDPAGNTFYVFDQPGA